MARKYKNVQGTNDFLVAAIGLLLLGLWAVKDGWYPSESTLEKHPIVSEAKFEQSGTVDEVLVDEEDVVNENSRLVSLRTTDLDSRQSTLERRLAEREEELGELEKAWLEESPEKSEMEVNRLKAEKQQEIVSLRKEIAGIKQERMKMMLRPTEKGEVAEIEVESGESVEAGDTGVVIRVEDHFYIFNKSLAVGSLLGALICAFMHLKLR